jgi:hypothetical protein
LAREPSQGGSEEKHRFFLNPYEDTAFTKCPKCESKTKVRKFPLVIHIEPGSLLVLNKRCRYCVACDLIITHRWEVESLMAAAFESRDPEIIGNEYVVVGTLPREVWRSRDSEDTQPPDTLDRTHIFKDVWEFELVGHGWGPADSTPHEEDTMPKRNSAADGGKTGKRIKRVAKARPNTTSPEVVELKITLRHTKPPIWRTLAVPGDVTLAGLHDIIQAVMGWCDCHLHQFIGDSERLYSSGFLAEDDADVIDGTRVRFCDLIDGVGSRLLYQYDFGDGWEHELKVVSIGPPKPGVKYPVCLAGARACPPEDCGGIGGYYDLLKIIADPKHEEHESMLEWVGEGFDPEAFDVEEVSSLLPER